MAKKNTLLAMLTGAALAGGLVYLKNASEKRQAAADADLDIDADDIPEAAEESDQTGWRATYTINGEELSSEEVRERFKEEAGKAFSNFKEDAKVVADELMEGLKKAIVEVSAAVDEIKKSVAEQRAGEAAEDDVIDISEDFEDASEAAAETAEEACEAAEEAAEEIRDLAEEAAEEVSDLADELKDKLEDLAEEIREEAE